MKDRTLLSSDEGLMNSQRKADFHPPMQKHTRLQSRSSCRHGAASSPLFIFPLRSPPHLSQPSFTVKALKPWMSF